LGWPKEAISPLRRHDPTTKAAAVAVTSPLTDEKESRLTRLSLFNLDGYSCRRPLGLHIVDMFDHRGAAPLQQLY